MGKIILLAFFFLIQNKTVYPYSCISEKDTVYQQYDFFDNKIAFQVIGDKSDLTLKDTLNIKVIIKNTSLDSIFIIKDCYVKLNKPRRKEDQLLYVDFGAIRNLSSDYPIQLYYLGRDSSYTFNIHISGTELEENFFDGYFQVMVGLSYIPSMAKIKEYESKYYIESKWLSENIIEVSSQVFDLASESAHYSILQLKFNK
jgi:hypothetical protein